MAKTNLAKPEITFFEIREEWGAAPIDTVTLVTVSIFVLVDISLVLVLVTIPLSMYRTPENPSSVNRISNFDLNRFYGG